MLNLIRMPTKDELAKLPSTELWDCVQVAFYQWQEAKRQGRDTNESEKIFEAYDYEHLRRLGRFEKLL
jgi:hypothetical protein